MAVYGALVDRVRRLINDPVGAEAIWTDDEIQEWLDAHRLDVALLPLQPVWSTVAGTAAALEYVAPYGHWAPDALLQDSSGAELLPESADLLVGRWHFAEHTPQVFLTGKSYDPYAAAADALEARAAQVALAYDFSADGATFQRSQQGESLLRLAQQYRSRSRPTIARLVREDTR